MPALEEVKFGYMREQLQAYALSAAVPLVAVLLVLQTDNMKLLLATLKANIDVLRAQDRFVRFVGRARRDVCRHKPPTTTLLLRLRHAHRSAVLVQLTLLCVGVVSFCALATLYCFVRRRPVYLLDFAVYQPPDDMKCTKAYFMQHSRDSGYFDEQSLEFQAKLLERTGIGEETYFPRGILAAKIDTSLEAARAEARDTLVACFKGALDNARLAPADVDILIVNCSLFNPTPSLASMIVNEFKLKSTVRTYNLAGMGCSAGLISVDLARDLLQVRAARAPT